MSAGADRTAFGPMVIVAADQHENRPLIDDPLARRILPAGGRLAVALAKYGPIRRAMITATEKKIPGLWASMLCRKRYIDDNLVAAAGTGIEAVVILGAGFDTRAYRLPALATIPVYEVDLPANIDRKRAALTRMLGHVPDGVTLVPVDFETHDLAGELARCGYDPGVRTFFVWEAVTQYLTEDGVRRTFDVLATARPESQLVFTYVREDFLDGTTTYGAEAAYAEFVRKRRLWRFGLAPGQVGGFLTEYGWHELDQAGPEQFTARYLEPAGRALPVSGLERSVHAVKR